MWARIKELLDKRTNKFDNFHFYKNSLNIFLHIQSISEHTHTILFEGTSQWNECYAIWMWNIYINISMLEKGLLHIKEKYTTKHMLGDLSIGETYIKWLLTRHRHTSLQLKCGRVSRLLKWNWLFKYTRTLPHEYKRPIKEPTEWIRSMTMKFDDMLNEAQFFFYTKNLSHWHF